MNKGGIMITVYTKPSCQQCRLTYAALDAKGIAYEIVDISEHPEAVDYIQDLDPAYLSAPVVVVDDEDHWNGFQPDHINRLSAAGLGRKELSVEEADQLVGRVAELLPFTVTLDADMGGTWASQIYFGEEIDDSTGRPVHRAGIDPDDAEAVWWIDFDGGDRQEISELGGFTAPEHVAAWIAAHSGMGE